MNGELERHGEAWRLRFTRRLPHAVDDVWAAITEPDHLKAWFPDGIAIPDGWRAGGRLRFGSSHVGEFDGEIRVVEPPTTLEFTWGTDLLRFELGADGDGCVLTLLDTIDEVGKAARDGAGWHVCLDALEAHLAGRDAPDGGAAWRAVHPSYVAGFGPEAATIGPPETAPA